MSRYSTAARISFGLAFVTLSALFLSYLVGLQPDSHRATQNAREAVAEAVAIGVSLAVHKDDVAMMKILLEALAQRNEEVVSAGIRTQAGELLVDVGNHPTHWRPAAVGDASLTALKFTLYGESVPWGDIEILFKPIDSVPVFAQFLGATDPSLYQALRAILFVSGLGFVCHTVYMRRVLKHLDPSSVIPERVREMLNTLSEGALILNGNGDIVLANESFGKTMDLPPSKLLGVNASRFQWQAVDDTGAPAHADAAAMLPWDAAIQQERAARNVGLRLAGIPGGTRTFNVNATLITGADRKPRGVMVTFDDVTTLERKNRRLRKMLAWLKESQQAIRLQNQQLHTLATRDPLTGCLNRRAFLEAFSDAWSAANRHRRRLGVIMVDVDHFKAINDNHGHSRGDEVLKGVAEALKAACRDGDHVCRYGGEEFCILIVSEDIAESVAAAERCRQAVAAAAIAGIELTVSVGVAMVGPGAESPQALIDQADVALYAAKRGGRNRVMTWDEAAVAA